jgi:uncharacterized repeat protein (TIGR03803 family)
MFMNHKRSSLSFAFRLGILAAFLTSAGSVSASDPGLKMLYTFIGPTDGENPAGSLVFDKAGNLYGTTEYGGEGGYYGTVFRLTPPTQTRRHWTETTLYSFQNRGDGARPTDNLIFDSSGNLYGTTSDSNAGGYGEVFELSPATRGGAWTEKVLYSFQGGTDGAYPDGGLIFDPAGNLYGTTESSVFELSPPVQEGGDWTFTLLHDFQCCTSDGWSSHAGLVRDQAGNLYGTTEWGGAYTGEYCAYLGCGTVFEVSPPAAPGDPWRESVLYRFGGESDGLNPLTALVLDEGGNLYGTTYGGGALGGGTAFQLAPPAQPGAPWTKTILHNFSYSSNDGAVPLGTMIFDKAGNLYGTTLFGGNDCYYNTTPYGCGTVFELTPPSEKGGAWTETLLELFTTYRSAPRQPTGGVILDGAGNLYGTTTYGGLPNCSDDAAEGCGTVYKIVR